MIFHELRAVVFDWAGTTVDYGCCAPAIVFKRIFAERGVEITTDQAREPMGMAKREHIAAISRMPSVAKAWQNKHNAQCSEADIDAMYSEFLPLQKSVLSDYSNLIPGAAEAASELKAAGLRIGSSTGYTRELMSIVEPLASKQGYEPEFTLCSEDAPRGRPAPFLLFEAAKRFDLFPMWRFIKVDDTPVGIQAGRNAGCWTIGVTKTGNCVGYSEQELARLDPVDVSNLMKQANRKLIESGAHFVVESVAEVPHIARQIDLLLQAGCLPN